MGRPEFPGGVLTAGMINRINESQRIYDENPERWERQEQEREEYRQMEEEMMREEEHQMIEHEFERKQEDDLKL